MSLTFVEACRRFESHLRVEKNLSPKTRTAYLYDLRRFLDHARAAHGWTGDVRLDRLETTDIRAYIHHLREELGCRATTLSRAVSSIRVFFAFCVEREWLDVSPATGIHNPKQTRKLPVYLVEGELGRLIGSPDISNPAGLRDRAMLILMAFGGLRLQEVVGLNLSDLDFDSRTIRVMGKGSKERMVPMNDDLAEFLWEWLRAREAAAGEKAVFVNRFGRRLSGRMVEKIVDKYVASSGIDKRHLSPHKLRHTFATLLHANDVDLVEIQALLGHASISTTQIYTHTDRRRLQDAVEKLSALEKGSG